MRPLWRLVVVVAAGLVVPLQAMGQSMVQAEFETAFALALYRQLDKAPGNFLVSPYSIGAAVGMVYAGAKGETAAEIARALQLPAGMDQAVYARAWQSQPAIGGGQSGIIFEAANALWGAKAYPFKPDYVATIAADFGGALTPVDFANAQAAAGLIDDWVAGKTAGKIRDLVPAAALSVRTRLVLTNAVYFKAPWSTPFMAYATQPAPFHTGAGAAVDVPMMNAVGDYMYGRAGDVQVLSLAYGDGGVAFVILLPDRVDGLAELEAGLTPAELQAWLETAHVTRVRLALPKFRTESRFDLMAPLRGLGIRDAFEPARADLRGMADVPEDRLYISDVFHRSYIDVDESGTEAAAATAMVAAGRAMVAPPPVSFTADHPFMYLIRDVASGQILFMGRMAAP